MDTEHTAITEPVRRVEVFTGAGRRRTWTADDKARIVAECATGEESVCAVARRHGLSPQQLFGWRRQAREATAGKAEGAAPLFVPAVVDAARSAAPARPTGKPERKRRGDNAGGMIEIEIAGTIVRVGLGVDAETLAAVIAALKAAT